MNKSKANILKKTAIIAIPLILIWIVLIGVNLQKEKEQIISNLIYQNETKDSTTEFFIDTYIDEIIENLKIIRDTSEFQRYLEEPSEENFGEVELMFQRIMKNKKDYDQLRLIDKSGMEIIRVDNEDNDVIETCSQDELQDKSDRYYFVESKSMAYDEIFISPLDLNVESGIIELPHNPMVRFATPLYNNENQFLGILIINYKAEYFVEVLKKHEFHEELENVWFYVVNSHGEFILHEDDENNFSFMFEEIEDLHVSGISEDIWNEVKENDKGYIEYSDKLITYYDVLSKTRSENKHYKERWVAIHEMDTSTLFSTEAIINELTLGKNLVVVMLIMLFAFVYAYIEEKAKKKDSRLEITELIAGSTNDGVMITDADTNITYVNPAFEEITGYKQNEVIGMQPRDFKSGKQDDEFYDGMWHDINQRGYWEGMLWDKKKSGVLYPQRMRIIAVKNKNSSVHHYVSIFNDASMQKDKMNNLIDIGNKNGNIFVPNEEMMIQLLKKSVKDKSFSFMILYIAIENYNQLIASFVDFESKSAELFINLIKPFMDGDDFIAQTSRNMFAVIVDMKHMQQKPEAFVAKIKKSLSGIIEINGRELFFKTRMGVSFWPGDTDDLKKLLLNSIIALEWSSSRSAGEVAFFKEEMILELNRENEIEAYLRNAIDRNELFMVYQPQVDSSTGKIIGVEALIRWNNDKLGFVSPSVFIPIAERCNLIIEIGYWIVKRVCADLIEIFKDMPDKYKNKRCAINLSPVQMQEGVFLEKLFDIINKSNISYENLEIEITESFLLTNQEKGVEMLKEMREAGLKIAIDDFGTGYSSLSYLNTLPIDKIKIDRSFIKGYPDYDDGKLISILVDMAESLGIDILTEGAETKQQVDFLREIGCTKIQGYYYSKPLDKAAFIEYLLRD